MIALRTVILVHGESALRELERIVGMLPPNRSHEIVLELLSDDLQQSLPQWRERERHQPLGFIAKDEPSALLALAAGVDEATVLQRADVPSLLSFIERVELRAKIRAETERLHESLAHAEKLTALGTLIASISHEINNPLSVVVLSMDALRRSLGSLLPAIKSTDEWALDVAAILADATAASNAIATIVRDLRVFVRADENESPELLDVRELVDRVLRLLGRDVLGRGLIECDYAPNLPLLVVPRSRLTQAVLNVLINAVHATLEVERPLHRVRINVRSDEDFVAIAVSDTGPGIAPESLERIFDPFFTTKRQDLGTGLGLSIARSILRALGGELTVESVYGEGATFICFVPIPSVEMTEQVKRRTLKSSIGVSCAPATVLIVSEEPRVLRAYARALGSEHRVLTAEGAQEAIELLESDSAPDVAVIELDSRAKSRPVLLDWLEANRPALAARTLIVTSEPGDLEHAALLAAYGPNVLTKPVRAEALRGAVAALLVESGGERSS